MKPEYYSLRELSTNGVSTDTSLVKVESDDGRLRLRFTYGGKRYAIAVGLPDSKVNRNLDCPEQDYCADDEAIRKLLGRARKLFKSIHTAFSLKMTKQTKPIQFINHLLNRVSLRLKCHKQLQNGQRIYRVDLEWLNDQDRLAVLESLTQKWSQLGSESAIRGSQQTPIDIKNTGICCDSAPLCDENELPTDERENRVSIPEGIKTLKLFTDDTEHFSVRAIAHFNQREAACHDTSSPFKNPNIS